MNIFLALLFLALSFKNVIKPYSYFIIILGVLLIISNIKVVFFKEDFLNIHIILFGPLFILLGITEKLKNLSFIVGISIILFYIKEKYKLELFNKF